MPTVQNIRIDFEITQPRLLLNAVDGVNPTDYAYIVFSQWYKGDKGQDGRDGVDGTDGQDGFSPIVTVTPTEDGHEVTITDAAGDHTFDVNDGVGIPQTLSIDGNDLTLSDGGGTVTLPDGLPSQTGQSGKFLTTDGTDASWDDIPAGNLEVTFTVGENDTITCDKTLLEICTALDEGRLVTSKMAIWQGITLQLNATAYVNSNVNRAVILESDSEILESQTLVVSGASEYDSENGTWGADTWSLDEMKIDYNNLDNLPTLGTASAFDVAESGNASTTQVVKGDDTRLSDSRNAADVYSWAKAATKPSYTASEVGAIASSEKGSNNGVAELDATGKVPSSQLPSYVDDVEEGYLYNGVFYEDAQHTEVIPAESGKIYVDLDTDKEYRWGGSIYVEIAKGLALGETASTAYAGNKGKANADAISAIKDGTSIDSFGDVETALAGKQDTLQSMTTAEIDTIWNTIMV